VNAARGWSGRQSQRAGHRRGSRIADEARDAACVEHTVIDIWCRSPATSCSADVGPSLTHNLGSTPLPGLLGGRRKRWCRSNYGWLRSHSSRLRNVGSTKSLGPLLADSGSQPLRAWATSSRRMVAATSEFGSTAPDS